MRGRSAFSDFPRAKTQLAYRDCRCSSRNLFPPGHIMIESTRIRDLSALEISQLLAASSQELSDSQAALRREFIDDIGGLENAVAAVRMLADLENG